LQRNRLVVTPPDPGHRAGPQHDLVDQLLLVVVPAQGKDFLAIPRAQVSYNVLDRIPLDRTVLGDSHRARRALSVPPTVKAAVLKN
jgi:hypothetical protein